MGGAVQRAENGSSTNHFHTKDDTMETLLLNRLKALELAVMVITEALKPTHGHRMRQLAPLYLKQALDAKLHSPLTDSEIAGFEAAAVHLLAALDLVDKADGAPPP